MIDQRITIMKCKKRVYIELSQELKKIYGEESVLESASKEQLYSTIWSWLKKKIIDLSRYKDTELFNIEPFENLPGCLLVDILLELDLLLYVNEILYRLGYSIDDIKKMSTYSSLRDSAFTSPLSAWIMLNYFLHRPSKPPFKKWHMPTELSAKAGVLNPRNMYGRADCRYEASHEATLCGRKICQDKYRGHRIPDKPYHSIRPFRNHSYKLFVVHHRGSIKPASCSQTDLASPKRE